MTILPLAGEQNLNVPPRSLAVSLWMDGADHVSRREMPIGRLISRDRKNGWPASGHVTKTNGQDFHCVDEPGFTLECYF
jgi:hypothetical protein